MTKIMEIGDIFSVSGGCTVLAGSELPNEELSMDFLSEIKNKKVYVKSKDGLTARVIWERNPCSFDVSAGNNN